MKTLTPNELRGYVLFLKGNAKVIVHFNDGDPPETWENVGEIEHFPISDTIELREHAPPGWGLIGKQLKQYGLDCITEVVSNGF